MLKDLDQNMIESIAINLLKRFDSKVSNSQLVESVNRFKRSIETLVLELDKTYEISVTEQKPQSDLANRYWDVSLKNVATGEKFALDLIPFEEQHESIVEINIKEKRLDSFLVPFLYVYRRCNDLINRLKILRNMR